MCLVYPRERPARLLICIHVLNNPVNFSDPTGHCAEFGDDVCWNAYDRIINMCPYCADFEIAGKPLHEQSGRFLTEYRDQLLDGWRPPAPPKADSPPPMSFTPPDATAWGISGNGDLPFLGPSGVSGAFGGEVVFNDTSGEISLFSFAGWGGTLGAGANALIYRSKVYNLPENDLYSGGFWIADASGSLGPIGISTGTFGVPLDDPLNPSQANGTYIGYAPGADGSVSLTIVEYTPWVTYNKNTGLLTLHFLDDLSINPNIFFGGD